MTQDARFFSFNAQLRNRFPYKVRKIGIDAGFTCPNRDGSRAIGGCLYCNNRSFSSFAASQTAIEEQIREGIRIGRRRDFHHFIAYFQAYTNTYAPTSRLKEIYETALGFPEIVGISIGTRPDCLSDSTIDLISTLGEQVAVWLEIGMESSHDRTLLWLNRAHSYAEFEDAARRTAHRPFQRVVHAIYGLPGESYEDMMQTTDRIATSGFDSAKIHHLYVSEGTPLEELYRNGEISLYTREEWIPLAADILERLPEEMSIQRLCGELKGEGLVAPRWGVQSPELIQAIEAELARRGSRQGCRVTLPTSR